MKYTVLVCDDDEDILSVLKIYLTQEGYDAISAANGLEALQAVERGSVHLIILDVMMPVMDGIAAAIKIRDISNVPIIFLSAKNEDTDRILGLNMGGDDYIAKPFNAVELLARVKAALRRYARLGGLAAVDSAAAAVPAVTAGDAAVANTAGGAAATAAKSAAESDCADGCYKTGGLILDDNRKIVSVDGDEVTLTAIEFNILKLLMGDMERVYTSAQIYEQVWREPAFHVSKTVSVHIRHIREKIEINPKEPKYLKVIYGLGYKVAKLP